MNPSPKRAVSRTRQYGLRWPTSQVSRVYSGRHAAHGLAQTWKGKGVDAVVVAREDQDGDWRVDPAPAFKPDHRPTPVEEP